MVALRVLLIGVVGTVVILGGGTVVMKRLASQKQPPKRKPVKPKSQVVEVLVATRADHRISVSGFATAAPVRSIGLVAELAGRAVTVHPLLRPGGFIDAGETLLEIDTSNLDITEKRLAAEIARSRARKRVLAAQRTGATRALEDSKRAVTLTQRQLSRDDKLVKQGHLARAATDRTRIELTQRRDRLHSARTSTLTLPHQITQAAAEIEVAQQMVAQAALDRTRARLVAPFAVQVRTGALEEGDWITPGKVLARLEGVDALELGVALSVDELLWLPVRNGKEPGTRAEWAKLLMGRKATVLRRGSGPTERRWTGTVSRVGPGLAPRSRSIQVFVRVDNTVSMATGEPPLPLLPGMFCRVEITGRTLEEVVVLPRKALQEENTVFVVSDKGTLERRTVAVRRRSGDLVVLSKGLKGGERVILTGVSAPVEGTPLRVRGEATRSKGDGKKKAE